MIENYYVLRTVNRMEFLLDLQEGDRVSVVLDGMHDNMYATQRDQADAMFVTFTDMAGSEVRVRSAHIEAFYSTSPEIRERDKEFAEYVRSQRNWDDE